MAVKQYDHFIRTRITQLRIRKNVSEHRMSLDLDKSGSYIRGITSGVSLPSLKELFNIMNYFNMTPAEFFSPTQAEPAYYHQVCQRLRELDEEDLKKVDMLLDWLGK